MIKKFKIERNGDIFDNIHIEGVFMHSKIIYNGVILWFMENFKHNDQKITIPICINLVGANPKHDIIFEIESSDEVSVFGEYTTINNTAVRQFFAKMNIDGIIIDKQNKKKVSQLSFL